MMRHRWLVGFSVLAGVALANWPADLSAQSASGGGDMTGAVRDEEPSSVQPPGPVQPIPGITDRNKPDTAGGLLGEMFRSNTSGIAFRPPIGCAKTDGSGTDDVANFKVEKKEWLLNVRRLALGAPMPLGSYRDPVDPQHNLRQGLVESTIEQLKAANPGAELVYHDDSLTVGAQYAGLVVMRFNLGAKTWLRQQLIVRVNDQLYYIFSFSTPSDERGKPVAAAVAAAPATQATTQEATTQEADADAGPLDTAAAATFNALRDSIRVLDLSKIKADQDQRLFRTRALFMNWTQKRFSELVIPQQYFRVVRDGKDIGWSYVEEMTGGQRRALEAMHKGDPVPLRRDDFVTEDGFVVYTRSFLKVDANTNLQTSSEMFVTFKRDKEAWAVTAMTTRHDKDGKESVLSHSTEFGDSEIKERTYFARHDDVPGTGVPNPADPKAPATRPVIEHTLDVSSVGKTANNAPVHRELAPWYLPQAIGAILPRAVLPPLHKQMSMGAAAPLLPSDAARGYMFCSYVSNVGEVMERYVDVSALTSKPLHFNGQTFVGVTVSDRIGLEGTPTVHYIDEEGQYRGCETRTTVTTDAKPGSDTPAETKTSTLMFIPSTHDGITAIWPDAVLAKPDYFERKTPE